ncbi:MAG: RNA polymerase sigma factor [Chloroflexota bacterium]
MSFALSTHDHMTASTPSIAATTTNPASVMGNSISGSSVNGTAVTTNWATNFNQSISINGNGSISSATNIPVTNMPGANRPSDLPGAFTEKTASERTAPAKTLGATTAVGSTTAVGATAMQKTGQMPGSIASSVDVDMIIQAARAGDDFAFTKLVDYYHGTAKRVAQHILRTEEAAADAVQEALIKAHRAMPRFKDGNFRSWLLRIVTNTCYDHLRRQKRRSAVSLDELVEQSGVELPTQEAPATENPETVTLHSETMYLLLEVIEELPVWHKNVVLLIDVHGYDYAEASEMLDLPLGTVKSRLSRARSALRNKLVEADLVPQHLRPQ